MKIIEMTGSFVNYPYNKNMWIPLNEYSHRFQVSISTLRRKIKSKTIKFKLERGKYFIWSENGESPSNLESEEVTPLARPSTSVERPTVPNHVFDALLEEKEKRIDLLEQHVRLLHQEIDSLQSLIKMLEAQ